MDPPYFFGNIALPKFKVSSCVMCSSGERRTFAFINDGQFSSAVDPKEIGEKAAAIIRASGMEGWVVIGKNYYGDNWMFKPVRLFIPSLSPLIVMTSPWSFKADPTSAQAPTYIFDEAQKFNERGFAYEKKQEFKLGWIEGIRNPFEFRSTLPKELTEVSIMSVKNKLTTKLPVNPGESISIRFDGQTILFTREQDQRVRIHFATM